MDKDRYFEQVLQELIESTTSQLRLWEQRQSEVEEQLKILNAKLVAYQTTLKGYWESIDSKRINRGILGQNRRK